MELRNLHLLPIGVTAFIFGTFIVTFCTAVLLDHVKPDFPYISDTGTLPPESCIFGQFINIASLLTLLCVGVRHQQVRGALARDAALAARLPRWLLRAAALGGAASALGFSVVANFQVGAALPVHLLGAALCMGGSQLYLCAQTFVSWRLRPEVTSARALRVRAALALLSVALGALLVASSAVAVSRFTGGDLVRWRPEHGGWAARVTSAACEWLLLACSCAFHISFYGEFKGLVLRGPYVRLEKDSKMDEAPRISHIT